MVRLSLTRILIVRLLIYVLNFDLNTLFSLSPCKCCFVRIVVSLLSVIISGGDTQSEIRPWPRGDHNRHMFIKRASVPVDEKSICFAIV